MGVAGKYGLNYLLGGPALGLGSMSLDLIKSVASKIKDEGINDVKKIFKQTTPESTQIRKNIHEFKSDFSQLLKESKINNLVVIIDDLDRCLPDTILNTLEAIKLFISTENTAFLISIDDVETRQSVRCRICKSRIWSRSIERSGIGEMNLNDVTYSLELKKTKNPQRNHLLIKDGCLYGSLV